MAGRRGGRGGAGRGISFNIENLGFGRGESLPGPILQPPALFPPLEQKPVPLEAGEEGDYLLALKQEYQGSMKESVYFLKELQRKRDIERYSDKYQLGQGEEHWEPDWSRIPSELRVNSKTKRKKVAMVPSLPAPDVLKTVDVDITKQLEVLEKKEADGSDKDEAAEDENADNEDLEEFYDEEEMEEETDYNMTYFDNGEIDADDDDLDDGPVY